MGVLPILTFSVFNRGGNDTLHIFSLLYHLLFLFSTIVSLNSNSIFYIFVGDFAINGPMTFFLSTFTYWIID